MTSVRQRWFSPRALLLHLGVTVFTAGCLAAGWWQVTRAMSGNTLSWGYSVEWPGFAVLALAGWWHLIHEDPDDRARRRTPPDPAGTPADGPVTAVTAAGAGAGAPMTAPVGEAGSTGAGAGAAMTAPVGEAGSTVAGSGSTVAGAGSTVAGSVTPVAVRPVEDRLRGPAPADGVRFDPVTTRRALRLAAGIGFEIVAGVAAMFWVGLSSLRGWVPPGRGAAVVFLVHAAFGVFVTLGAIHLLVRVRAGHRMERIMGWTGGCGVAASGLGGLLTEAQSLVRLLGIALMFVGSVAAILAYLMPTFAATAVVDPAGPAPALEAGRA